MANIAFGAVSDTTLAFFQSFCGSTDLCLSVLSVRLLSGEGGCGAKVTLRLAPCWGWSMMYNTTCGIKWASPCGWRHWHCFRKDAHCSAGALFWTAQVLTVKSSNGCAFSVSLCLTWTMYHCAVHLNHLRDRVQQSNRTVIRLDSCTSVQLEHAF